MRAVASSTMRALRRALVSVIISLLNDSECSLNRKWLRIVTNKSNPTHWLEINAKHLPTFGSNGSISYISTQRNIQTNKGTFHSKNRIWKYCVHSPSRKPIVGLVAIIDFRAIHLSTWIASAYKHLGVVEHASGVTLSAGPQCKWNLWTHIRVCKNI